ncbi:hypothetical protein [Loktanella sp. R86503]|uniref:hypothetical protein n=1 Tax=Loktanella sp. R86503 TaxID=3093847 RepID=UPI0036DE7631
MATVKITAGEVGARANNDNVMIYLGDTTSTETVTSSATSVQAALVAGRGCVAVIYCDTPLMVLSGENPTATATAGTYCPAGMQTYIAVQKGHKIAVIDA